MCLQGISRDDWHMRQQTERETHLDCGQHCPIGLEPGKNTKERKVTLTHLFNKCLELHHCHCLWPSTAVSSVSQLRHICGFQELPGLQSQSGAASLSLFLLVLWLPASCTEQSLHPLTESSTESHTGLSCL